MTPQLSLKNARTLKAENCFLGRKEAKVASIDVVKDVLLYTFIFYIYIYLFILYMHLI